MNASLRLRLIVIILTPLLIISGLLAVWAFYDAQDRANTRFDRSLLSAALAVSRDIALSGGDALSPETNALLRDTSGGPVYYHVFAPDGVFVTGYATPPIPGPQLASPQSGQAYFDGLHLGADIRALRYSDVMQIDGVGGEFTFTVWQKASLRRSLVQEFVWRTFQVMAVLIGAVALIVWFGVRYGLRPLLSLEAAIARRSPDDLTAIQRKVPQEAKGIVATLNRLFAQVTSAIEAKDVFISNAAHQLRNPIAGVVAMSDALVSARTLDDMRERSQELAKASRRAGDLANKLLALERASATSSGGGAESIDIGALIRSEVKLHGPIAAARGIVIQSDLADPSLRVTGDRTMIQEAVTNLVENALLHGGSSLRHIAIGASENAHSVCLSVTDDGVGMSSADTEKAKGRFSQLHTSEGSGLGLAIADAVATQHRGRLAVRPLAQGLSVEMEFPKSTDFPSMAGV